MIIIGGTIQYESDDREALLAAIRRMIAASQAEDGCIAYEVSADLSDPDTLHLFEVWESAAHLDAHANSPHFKVFETDIRPSFVKTNIKRYDAELAS